MKGRKSLQAKEPSTTIDHPMTEGGEIRDTKGTESSIGGNGRGKLLGVRILHRGGKAGIHEGRKSSLLRVSGVPGPGGTTTPGEGKGRDSPFLSAKRKRSLPPAKDKNRKVLGKGKGGRGGDLLRGRGRKEGGGYHHSGKYRKKSRPVPKAEKGTESYFSVEGT